MTRAERGPRRTWHPADRIDHLLAVIERWAVRQPGRREHIAGRYAQAWELAARPEVQQ